jgi:hypothetical protein
MIAAGTRRRCRAALAIVLGAALATFGAARARAADAPSVSLHGHASWETFGYPDDDTRDQHWESFFELGLRAHGSLHETVDFELEGRVVADDARYTAGVYSLRNATVRRPYLSLTTAALHWRPIPELRFSVGKQVVNWDTFDGIQPANLLSTLDQSDPFRPVTQGVNGLTVHWQPSAFYADVTVVPVAFTPARSPQNRWIIIPDAVGYHQHLPPVQFDETQAGARLGGRVGGLDASVFGYVGRDYLPLFVLNFERLSIESRAPRLRAGGFNASHPIGDRLLLRVEGVYLGSPDANRGDFWDSLVGGEWTYGDWRVVLGYLRQDRLDAPDVGVVSQGERVFFQSFVSGEVRWDDGGPWQAHVRGGYDTRGEFALIEPEVSFRPWRPLVLTLTGNYIASGRRNTYFERIRHEDRVGLRVEYQF